MADEGGVSKNALKKQKKEEENALKKQQKEAAKAAAAPAQQKKSALGEETEELDPTKYYENRLASIAAIEVRLNNASSSFFFQTFYLSLNIYIYK